MLPFAALVSWTKLAGRKFCFVIFNISYNQLLTGRLRREMSRFLVQEFCANNKSRGGEKKSIFYSSTTA